MFAKDVVEEFQDGADGWDDRTVLLILCEFIDKKGLTKDLLEKLETSWSAHNEEEPA